jgi:hypothetical protein
MDRRSFVKLSGAAAGAAAGVGAFTNVSIAAPASDERSISFAMTVNGKPVDVRHGAANYSFANFDVTQPVTIVITAATDGFWDKGVEVLPSRHGIRPTRAGRSISFRLDQPQKLAISRPGDYFAKAELLFLFANAPEHNTPAKDAPNVRYIAPGVHREHIHVKSGQTIYLAEGAVVLGSLNFWDVGNAAVIGRGVVIHDGPQNPDNDEGWQHRPDWHGITMHNASNIQVRDITVIVRSRTWMIQLQGSKQILFDNIKVIGGTGGNANQDGIDWLGCGDTIVRDCFFRSSDDIFAIYGNTGFYDKDAAIPGQDVRNILIEGCVLSTSISNVMRVGWQNKIFNSSGVTLRDSDIIHMGMGDCFVPFALAEFWADPGGQGTHEDYLFDDLRLESCYSLTQMRQSAQPTAKVRNIHFRNIRLVDRPPMVPSTTSGDVSGVTFENITMGDRRVGSDAQLPLIQQAGAAPSAWVPPQAPGAEFSYTDGLLTTGRAVRFDARGSRGRVTDYQWLFGDGSRATGAVVDHVFADAAGTMLDGTGRFRVQLTVTDARGRRDTLARPVVIASRLLAPARGKAGAPGLRHGDDDGREGYLTVPADGGYTFTMMARDGARLRIGDVVLFDDRTVEALVCNGSGNRMQQLTASVALRAGRHRIAISGGAGVTLYWQTQGIRLEPVDEAAFSH